MRFLVSSAAHLFNAYNFARFGRVAVKDLFKQMIYLN